MPRTKAVSTTTKKNEKTSLKMLNSYFDQDLQRRNEALLESVETIKKMVSSMMRNFIKDIPSENVNKTIVELESIHDSLIKSQSINSSKESNLHLTTSTKKRNKRSLSYTEDDGYLTAESRDSGTTAGRRTSRARSKLKTTNKSRVSRSLSRSNIQKHVSVTNSYKTPLLGKKPLCFGTVTPKMKPNTPQVLLRRPAAGEVAISLQGSPLMLNSGADSQPNVNIPLMDGRMLCIQPQRGLRISQIPELDPTTKRQIQALRDNLERVCGGFK